MTRRRVAIGSALLAALLAGVVAINELGNASARAELGPACACARASVERTLEGSGAFFYRLFEDDAGEVRAFLRDEVAGLCAALDAELVPLTWNLGRSYSPAPDLARAARVRAILARARPRCPEVWADALGPLGGGESGAREACERLFSGMEPAGGPPASIATWAWPAAIERSMCLP